MGDGIQSLFCVDEEKCGKVVARGNMYLCVEKCLYPVAFVDS